MAVLTDFQHTLTDTSLERFWAAAIVGTRYLGHNESTVLDGSQVSDSDLYSFIWIPSFSTRIYCTTICSKQQLLRRQPTNEISRTTFFCVEFVLLHIRVLNAVWNSWQGVLFSECLTTGLGHWVKDQCCYGIRNQHRNLGFCKNRPSPKPRFFPPQLTVFGLICMLKSSRRIW